MATAEQCVYNAAEAPGGTGYQNGPPDGTADGVRRFPVSDFTRNPPHCKGTSLAAPHQTPDRAHQLVLELFRWALRGPADDAVGGVVVQQSERDLVEGGLDR
jgi:hypothetical protein